MDTPDRIDLSILARSAVLVGTFMWECAEMPCNCGLDPQSSYQGLSTESTAAIIPKRLIPGCLTGASNPDANYAKWPLAWNTAHHVPLFWADGKRNLEQIVHLAAAELGRTDIDVYRKEIMEFFEFLAESGYVFLKYCQALPDRKLRDTKM